MSKGENMYIKEYKTPNGFDNILLTSDGKYLTGLYFKEKLDNTNYEYKELDIFNDTIKWLDIYFSKKVPDFTPKYKLTNLTEFRKEVISILSEIPYGKVITYKDVTELLKVKKGINSMSYQAVGTAIGHNPICIIIPCHRVIGSNNKLGGYSGGINNKIKLLELEKINIKELK